MFACVTYRRKNRAGTILDHLQSVCAQIASATQDLRNDGSRIFIARIVAGDNEMISRQCSRAHLRPLAWIAIATAAEYAPEFSVAGIGQLTQRMQGLFQRIRRVRIVDDRQRTIMTTQLLHAPGHGCQCFKLTNHAVLGQSAGKQHAGNRQHIADVEMSDQMCTHEP